MHRHIYYATLMQLHALASSKFKNSVPIHTGRRADHSRNEEMSAATSQFPGCVKAITVRKSYQSNIDDVSINNAFTYHRQGTFSGTIMRQCSQLEPCQHHNQISNAFDNEEAHNSMVGVWTLSVVQ